MSEQQREKKKKQKKQQLPKNKKVTLVPPTAPSSFPSVGEGEAAVEGEKDFDIDTLVEGIDGEEGAFWPMQKDPPALLPTTYHSTDQNLPSVGLGSELIPSITSSKAAAKTPHLDPLTLYMREIGRYPLLSLEQEKALTMALVETGDLEVAKKLVQANLRLVVKIAMEYRYAHQNLLDLIQEGNIGLMKAVSKFDPNRGAKLSYYASWWIRSYILKYILDNFRLVKIGTTSEQKRLFYNLLREKERLQGLGVEPELKQLSENLGVSEKSVALMDQRLSSSGVEFSIDRPLFDSGSKSTVADVIPSEQLAPEELLGNAQELEILKKHLHIFMGSLKERDRIIFEKRLLSEIPPSLQNIADEYGVSRERIRQVEERLIKKLKVYMSEFIR